jgi:hypothetical protein
MICLGANLGSLIIKELGMAGGVVSTMRYMGGVAGTTAVAALLNDASSPASHHRPLPVYAGALVVAALLSGLLPGREKRLSGNQAG